MRKRKLVYNTISSFGYQLTAIICGFILPRMILETYGSAINGAVSSITQFLQVIAFLDFGVGAVVKSSMYKPLAEKDDDELSKIIASANTFFKRLSKILLVYIIVLCFIIPAVVSKEFDFIFTCTLILSMSISMFAQYYFGIVNQLLLTADQKAYIQYNVQIATLVINTVFCVILIKMGASIQVVKLVTSLIFLIRPLYYKWYVANHYNIIKKITYDTEPIKQKWNGFAQHLASVILDSTDVIVLTIFATLESVSIYSVYFLVIQGVKQLLQSTTNGIQSLLGELYAKKEYTEMNKVFDWSEWTIHTVTVFVFGCTAMLIVPFVRIYTDGVKDINYIVPVFAGLLVLAHAMHCLRMPYNIMILAAGKYKETQSNYIMAMLLNILLSILTVKTAGIVGVAIGTFVAMFYQTIWMVLYNSKYLLKRSLSVFVKQIIVDSIIVVLGCLFTHRLELKSVNYMEWIVLAIKNASIWGGIIFVVNFVFFKDKLKKLIRKQVR